MDGQSSSADAGKGESVSRSPTDSSGSRLTLGLPATLPATKRLRKPWEFRRVYDQGNKQVGKSMVLWIQTGEGDGGRVGVVASKKTGNAVVRARCKRRLRELYRLHQHEIILPHELVLVARRGLNTADWNVILAEFTRLLRNAELLR